MVAARPQRSFGSRELTWSQLLFPRLRDVHVFVLFFASRFDTKLDHVVREMLRTFGEQTPPNTSVNFWDPRDPQFDAALRLFDKGTAPAVVLVTDLALEGVEPAGPDYSHFYSIVLTKSAVLENRERLAEAVGHAHTVLLHGDPKEIVGFIRSQRRRELIAAVGSALGSFGSALLLLHPRFGLPGGMSVEIGPGEPQDGDGGPR